MSELQPEPLRALQLFSWESQAQWQSVSPMARMEWLDFVIAAAWSGASKQLEDHKKELMNIVLTGFMGTGKSAVGRHLADELHVPFVDVDTALAKKAGKTVQDIFAFDGEAAFRALESQVIAELSSHDKTVISTGGGALLDPKNRQVLEKNGILVCLTAKMGTLLERLKDDLTRPLLAGENLEHKVERLMKERQDIYNLCPIQIDTEGKSIAQVSDEIIQKVSSKWQA